MKKTLFAVLAFAMMNMAMATSSNNNGPTTNQGGDASAVAQQGQLQAQGQLQGQAQLLNNDITIGVNANIDNDVRNTAINYVTTSNKAESSSDAVAVSGGNTQSVMVMDSGKMEYSGSYTVKSAPSITGGNIYPTSPCMGSSSVGGSTVGVGFNFGTSWKDDECGIRETARSFAGMDMKDDAVAILCTSEYAKAAPACNK